MSDQESRLQWLRPPWRGAAAPRMSTTHRRALLAFAFGLILALLDAQAYLAGARLDERIFDAQVMLVRMVRPAAVTAPRTDVVLVGVDEASLDALAEPLSLMHATLGTALTAIAHAQPHAIGLDIALPERSFDRLQPGLDAGLMRGLQAARVAAPFALALDTDARGQVRVPHAPLLAIAGGADVFGLPLFPIDCDGVVRRYEPDPGNVAAAAARCGSGSEAPALSAGAVPTFAGRLALQLGRASLLSEGGWVDFTRGAPFDYVPLQDVVRWQRSGAREQLLSHFGGQVVLVGSVLPYLDRLRLPVALARWENALVPPPGLIANAQVLRNVLGSGLVRAPPRSLAWLALVGLAAAALPVRAALRYLLLAASVATLLAGGALLHAAGWFVAPGAAIVAGISAVALRTGFDLAGARRDRERLARNFGGYLSPALLRRLLDETSGAAGALPGVRRSIALLFADLQDFTPRTEHSDPEQIRGVLNRYYAAITPGLHAHGGVIDNFRGDGIMVMFGALESLAHPCDAALAAACQLLEQIDRLNREELVPNGIAAVAVTMGMAYGEVVYGEVGSPDRRDFTALGDAVNVAAHLQGVAKQVGYPLVMTAVFAGNLARPPDGLIDLGMPAIKGHTPLPLRAWAPQGWPESPAETASPS